MLAHITNTNVCSKYIFGFMLNVEIPAGIDLIKSTRCFVKIYIYSLQYVL